jgi:alpha-1,6-mannosyltransferase
LKTAHLTNAWCSVSGGIATFYRALLEAANRRGHEMRLIVPAEEDGVEECGHCGRIYYVQAPKAPFNGGYRLVLPHRYLLPGSRIQRILAEEKPDLVEVCDKYTLNWLAGLLRIRAFSAIRKRPAVVGLSCERMDDNFRAYLTSGSVVERFCGAYMRWLYFPLFDHHITVSAHTAGELRAASGGHRVRRGVWIRPMGVDLTEMSPSRRSAEGRRRLLRDSGGDARTVLLFYAGRLAREKNLKLLIGTMAELARDPEFDYRLLIAGSGAVRPELEQEAAKLAPWRVSFLGHISSRDRLAVAYANADVFVHPNPAEPFGIAPLEAMASGLPLVAPAAGGITAYAHRGNCWLAAPEPAAFAAAVRAVQGDTEARIARVTAALETAKRFGWPSVCSSFLDLYAEIHALQAGAREQPLLPPDFVSTERRSSSERSTHDDHTQVTARSRS